MPRRPLLDIAALRQEYSAVALREADAPADPLALFTDWLNEASEAGIPEPNAMVLSTADASGEPSSRTVLLKGLDDRGFTFFTNRRSRKGRELSDNPHAALTFPWIAMRRQVTVQGVVSDVDDGESDSYFATRPRGSQLAAWASQQSDPLADRATLDEAMAEAVAKFHERPVPRPSHWGGYRLRPTEFEFWQGRVDRLHDRLRYRRRDHEWQRQRLWP